MKNNQSIQCVGFIMDGNRRWAKERGLPTLEGHSRGYGNLKEILKMVYRAEIPHMVVYAFSTENWKRTEEEVGYLMKLLHHALKELPEIIAKEGKRINIRVIGERHVLSKELQAVIAEVESKNYTDPELTVWVALSYGGRIEIIDAVNRAVAQGVPVTEGSFEKLLWTNGMPDPDIIIRTSGEKRISNFLLWQSAYSEFFFIDTYWPDFGENEFKGILEDYANRERRKGS